MRKISRPATAKLAALRQADGAAPKRPSKPKPAYLATPAVSGPAVVRVGAKEFGVPERSRIIRRKNVTYAKTPAGTLHALTRRGEAVIPPELHGQVEGLFVSLPPGPPQR